MKRREKRLTNTEDTKKEPKPNIFKVLKPYKGLLFGLLLFALLSNALNLVIPKIIQNGIDDFSKGHFEFRQIIIWFSVATAFIFVFSYIETVIQTYASEKVARDLRKII